MKKWMLSLLASLFCVSIMAQEDATEAIKKEIRDIKLSEKYIYGEGTSAKSLEVAHSIAAEKIHVNILTMLTDEGYSSKDANARWDELQASLKCLEYHQGPLYKSFAYLPEVALLKGVSADEVETTTEVVAENAVAEVEQVAEVVQVAVVEEAVEEVAEVLPPVEEQPQQVVVDTVAVEQPQPEVVVPEQTIIEVVEEVVVDTVAETQPVVEEIVLPSQLVAPIDTVKMVQPQIPEEIEEVEVIEPSEVPEEEFSLEAAKPAQVVVNHPFDEMPDYHQRIIRELLDMNTYDDVMLYLDTMKDDGRIMFGRVNTLINPEQAYLIIIKDGKLVTILNRGKGERTNLKTNTPDLLNNYRGYAVIWMKIYS